MQKYGGKLQKGGIDDKKIKNLTIVILLYMLCYYTWLFMMENNLFFTLLGEDIFSSVAHIGTIILLTYSYRKCRNNKKIYWLFLLMGSISYMIGDSIWIIYTRYEPVIPELGLFDIFYTLQILLFLCATIYLYSKHRSKYIGVQIVFDIFLIMTVAFSLSWHFVIAPIITQSSEDIFYLLINLLYPIGDLGFLFGTILIYIWDKKVFEAKARNTLLIGFTLFILADILYTYSIFNQSITLGNKIDPLWNFALLLIGLAGIMDIGSGDHNSYISCKDKEIYPETRKIQLILPYLSIILLLILAVMRFESVDGIVVGAVVAVVGGIIRQILILLENNRLVILLKDKNIQLENRKKEMEDLNKELKRISLIKENEARTDFLTNLYNRRFINEKLKIFYEEALKSKKSFSILILDVDHFKKINDNFGHEAGDTVLIKITDIIRSSTREIDIKGRFGGEEFIVILPEISEDAAQSIAERIRRNIGKNVFEINNESINITTSIGGSSLRLTDKKENIGAILLRADKALYQAKKEGRNKIVFN